MKQAILVALLAAVIPAMAETLSASPEIIECSQNKAHIRGKSFKCAVSAQENIRFGLHLLKKRMTQQQAATLEAEQQAWLAYVEKKIAHQKTWNNGIISLPTEETRNKLYQQRAQELADALDMYEALQAESRQ